METRRRRPDPGQTTYRLEATSQSDQWDKSGRFEQRAARRQDYGPSTREPNTFFSYIKHQARKVDCAREKAISTYSRAPPCRAPSVRAYQLGGEDNSAQAGGRKNGQGCFLRATNSDFFILTKKKKKKKLETSTKRNKTANYFF